MNRLLAIDRRFVFAAVAVALVATILINKPMLAPATPPVKAVFDHIQSLPKGSHVLIAFNYDPSAKAELQPMALAVVHHCYRRGVIPIGMTMVPAGVGLAKQALEETAKQYNKAPGRDFVFLGFKPGGSSLIINMGEDFFGAFPTDAYGNPTSKLPGLKGVRTLRDIDLVLDLSASSTAETWIVYGRQKYHFPLASGCTAVVAPDLYPFLQTGQLMGLIAGLKGAAEYEGLIHKVGSATMGMLPQSAVHLLIVCLVLVGNFAYALTRTRKGANR